MDVNSVLIVKFCPSKTCLYEVNKSILKIYTNIF